MRQQVHENARKMHRTKIPVIFLENGENDLLGGHDMVRRMTDR